MVEFPCFFTRETTFVTSCLLFCTPSSGFTLIGKNLLPVGAITILIKMLIPEKCQFLLEKFLQSRTFFVI